MKKFITSIIKAIFANKNKMVNDHFDGERFHNLNDKNSGERNFFDFLKWQLNEKKIPWPSKVLNTQTPNLLDKTVEPNNMHFTFINHATFLLQSTDISILTDPVFSQRASPLSWAGPKRVCEPGILLENLPKIDLVLISHNHFDHMDLSSLQKLAKKDNPLFIVPLKNAIFLKSKGIERIVELDWWQAYTFFNTTITLLPAKHWSKRSIFNANKALWGGFFIENSITNIKTFFAGDTGFSDHFQLISEKFNEIDVSLLPIGAYAPSWFMQANHINPEEAVKAHAILKSTLSIAMHYGTFKLSNEGYDDPVIDLRRALKKHNIQDAEFITPTNGQTIVFKK